MAKRKHIEAFAPHPRYGTKPLPSGLSVPEDIIRQGCRLSRNRQIFPESVLVADPEKQICGCCFPFRYYVDVVKDCRNCRRPFIFFAREQRHWYETLRFNVNADCVFCTACRHDKQTVSRLVQRYSGLLAKAAPTRKELMTLVDDGSYLLGRGVLRDLNRLGWLKNEARRRIGEYPGTERLAEAIQFAREAPPSSAMDVAPTATPDSP